MTSDVLSCVPHLIEGLKCYFHLWLLKCLFCAFFSIYAISAWVYIWVWCIVLVSWSGRFKSSTVSDMNYKTFLEWFTSNTPSTSSPSSSQSWVDACVQTVIIFRIIVRMIPQQRGIGPTGLVHACETLYPPPCCALHSAAGQLVSFAECQHTPCCGIYGHPCMIYN